VTKKEGTQVNNAGQLKTGEQVSIQFNKGKASADITEVNE
jgi:exonuclease VII large subunit